MSIVGNLKEESSKWTAGGVALPSMINKEMRKGKEVFCIKKALVELDQPMFKFFASEREAWKYTTAEIPFVPARVGAQSTLRFLPPNEFFIG